MKKVGPVFFLCGSDDDNKVFTIGFQLPSRDDTGVGPYNGTFRTLRVPQIPGQGTLCRTCERVLNTFLNAMTYSDKTVYPVASRNDKDFRNLVDVYLDAVFYPNTYKKPSRFVKKAGTMNSMKRASLSITASSTMK